MRVAGFEFARGDHDVLWWVGAEARRAAGYPSSEQTRAAFDRVVRVLPATAASAQTIQTSLGCLDDPGQPLVVHSRVVEDLVGLGRPLTAGNIAGPALVFTAAVDADALRLPLLSTDATALRAVTHALDARAGRELPWQTLRRRPRLRVARARPESTARRTVRSARKGEEIRGATGGRPAGLTSGLASRLVM